MSTLVPLIAPSNENVRLLGSPPTWRVTVPVSVLASTRGAVATRTASDCVGGRAILAYWKRASIGIVSAAGCSGVSISVGGPLGRRGVGLSAAAATAWAAGMRGSWMTLSHCGLDPHFVSCTGSTFLMGRSWLCSLDCSDDAGPMRANGVGRVWSSVRLPSGCHGACVPARDAGHWALVMTID